MLSAATWLVLRTRVPGFPPPQLVPLTTLDGWEWCPTFSPDGEQVAFQWNGEIVGNSDIYVKMVGSAEVRRLTTDPASDGYPAWSPDGRQIAFLRTAKTPDGLGGADDPPGLARRGAGPQAERITRRLGPLSWSPDGQWLAASHVRSSGEGGPEASGIYLIPASGGEPRLVTREPPPGDDASPAFSPDGHQLAYASCPGGAGGGCDIHVLDLGADLAPAGPPRRLTQHGVNIPFVAWTRDGASIVYCANEAPYLFHLWRVALRGHRPPERIELAGHRAWTPGLARSRARLAFSEALREVDIHRFLGGRPSEAFLASSFFEGHPRFSPDGPADRVCLHAVGRRMEIWLAAADGSSPVQLTRGPGHGQDSPTWSPDGQRIAFDSLGERRALGHLDDRRRGGAPRRLTQDPGDASMPSFSRDGRWVYFYSERDGSGQIWRVPAAGGAAERVTRGGAGRGAIESADGRKLLFKRSKKDSPLVALPLDGGPERTVAGCVGGSGRNLRRGRQRCLLSGLQRRGTRCCTGSIW